MIFQLINGADRAKTEKNLTVICKKKLKTFVCPLGHPFLD